MTQVQQWLFSVKFLQNAHSLTLGTNCCSCCGSCSNRCLDVTLYIVGGIYLVAMITIMLLLCCSYVPEFNVDTGMYQFNLYIDWLEDSYTPLMNLAKALSLSLIFASVIVIWFGVCRFFGNLRSMNRRLGGHTECIIIFYACLLTVFWQCSGVANFINTGNYESNDFEFWSRQFMVAQTFLNFLLQIAVILCCNFDIFKERTAGET